MTSALTKAYIKFTTKLNPISVGTNFLSINRRPKHTPKESRKRVPQSRSRLYVELRPLFAHPLFPFVFYESILLRSFVFSTSTSNLNFWVSPSCRTKFATTAPLTPRPPFTVEIKSCSILSL